MSLLVFPILQHVLGTAQKTVGVMQLVGDVCGDDSGVLLATQGRQQAALLKRGHASAANELVQLNDELDFAYASVTQLDVVCGIDPGTSLGAALPVLTNPFSQLTQGRQCIEIEILAVNEGNPKRFQLGNLRLDVAALKGGDRDGACFQPGIAFPFAALGYQVMFERVQAPGQWSGVSVGPQAQVGSEHLAIGVRF